MTNKISNKTNKYITVVIVLVVVFILASYLTSNTENANTTKVESVITVAESLHDFGDIDIFGGKVSTIYTLKNEGVEDVKILSAVTSCMCTEGEIGGMRFGMHEQSNKNVSILAGEEKILTATFDPLAHGPNGTGKITRELSLKTDSNKTPKIIVKFTANVVKNNND